jgi:hypothetical protein
MATDFFNHQISDHGSINASTRKCVKHRLKSTPGLGLLRILIVFCDERTELRVEEQKWM